MTATLLYPLGEERVDPLIFASALRLTAEFRRIGGRWRIADLTTALLWIDLAMSRFIAAKIAHLKG